MTLIQLQYFQAVCKFENFTRAAEALHISQPAMSAAMKDMERECGVSLFKRDKNSLKITDEGQILLEEANLVLGQYGHLEHVVKDLSLSRNYIRVGLSTLSGNQVYPRILQVYRKKYPDVQISSVEESTTRQFEMLDQGTLDLIITIKHYEDPGEQREFDKVYGHWPMVRSCQYLCVGKDGPLANESFVTLEQIAGEPMVMLKDNFSQSRGIRKQFRDRGLECNVIHYTNQMYTVERFVEQNIAVGFLPRDVAEGNPKIVGIPYEGTREKVIELFWRKDRFLFSATKNFIRTAKEVFPEV